MAIPPFPSQDLAKLVLGYLAEEQLMTAYDEFLQASPYLDALRNEYDRIFMTSLKNILAEYRAVKIFVETCKPLSLRRKLFQCTNLVEVVKFLVNHIDVTKIQAQDATTDKTSLPKHNTTTNKNTVCDVCNSLNITNCICKSRLQGSNLESSGQWQTTTLESSVETTALEDLPGNHITTSKKYARSLEKETIFLEDNVNLSQSNISNTKYSSGTTNTNSGQSVTHGSDTNTQTNDQNLLPLLLNTLEVKPTHIVECSEKIEEFNNILNQVCKEKSTADKILINAEPVDRISNTTTFHDFASGVCGCDNRNAAVPDSSTSENNNVQNTKEITRDVCSDIVNVQDIKKNKGASIGTCTRIKPKPIEQKIKILSDIKVDNPYNAKSNATSTPLMQSIIINGTQAYKQTPPMPNNSYTKDEIMAMPTLIVVPAAGRVKKLTQCQSVPSLKSNQVISKTKAPSKKINQAVSKTLTAAKKIKKRTSKNVTSSNILGPLVIDVSSPAENQTLLSVQNTRVDTGLVKTVDAPKMSSVPKDNVTCASETNTPQVLPPLRKASSTPRRNSHIRVLDFTTPRRILHDTINEQGSCHEGNDKSEVPPSNSLLPILDSDKIDNDIIDMSTVEVHMIETSNIRITSSKDGFISKKNWDADLRALAANEIIANEINGKALVKDKTKSKTKSQKKKEKDDAETIVEKKKSQTKKKLSTKTKNTTSKVVQKVNQEEDDDDSVKIIEGNVNVHVKPTINIITRDTNGDQGSSKQINSTNQNKSNKDDSHETPEAERMLLQNVIGARLNISELLETPYKQALYDIQMETPKFLGPLLPDEPISDIKIMNIPTPRFFDTPTVTQATPSSYSSRPTDYSSGGSYYKPDDQDYIPITDFECPVSSSSKLELNEGPRKDTKGEVRKTRPVRKCTKNVSYVNSTGMSSKIKEIETEDKLEIASSCGDSPIANSISAKKSRVGVKALKNTKPRSQIKFDGKNKLEPKHKYKSPIKKSKTFIKIKPRRPTPTKDNLGKSKRKFDTSQNSLRTQMKKKAIGKDKNIHLTPIVLSAPTKSRRKSSTPRKLHYTKIFNSESSGHVSPEIKVTNVKKNATCDRNLQAQDSDTEQIALRWSDDCSQDAKHDEKHSNNEIEDITKIQEYIQTTVHNKNNLNHDKDALHVDLIKRGFDAETAKIIERDLLDTPPDNEQLQRMDVPCNIEVDLTKKDDSPLDKSAETDNSANDLHIDQDAELEEDDIELSVQECNEECDNYVFVSYVDTKDKQEHKAEPVKLKDKFCMEVCIDDGVTIRLRANDLNFLIDQDPSNFNDLGYSFNETEIAVSSITNIDKLYTPLKDQMKATCYEIFDSTLTSLDTPLKPNSPNNREHEATEIEIVIEEETIRSNEKTDFRKRKRCQGSSSPQHSDNDSKKTKSEAQYLFTSTNIQNIDIESVLTKLHGP